jgi:hypothetical protein
MTQPHHAQPCLITRSRASSRAAVRHHAQPCVITRSRASTPIPLPRRRQLAGWTQRPRAAVQDGSRCCVPTCVPRSTDGFSGSEVNFVSCIVHIVQLRHCLSRSCDAFHERSHRVDGEPWEMWLLALVRPAKSVLHRRIAIKCRSCEGCNIVVTAHVSKVAVVCSTSSKPLHNNHSFSQVLGRYIRLQNTQRTFQSLQVTPGRLAAWARSVSSQHAKVSAHVIAHVCWAAFFCESKHGSCRVHNKRAKQHACPSCVNSCHAALGWQQRNGGRGSSRRARRNKPARSGL